jgi:hypothetical protein
MSNCCRFVRWRLNFLSFLKHGCERRFFDGNRLSGCLFYKWATSEAKHFATFFVYQEKMISPLDCEKRTTKCEEKGQCLHEPKRVPFSPLLFFLTSRGQFPPLGSWHEMDTADVAFSHPLPCCCPLPLYEGQLQPLLSYDMKMLSHQVCSGADSFYRFCIL